MDQRLVIDWDITTLCNFKCSYCWGRNEYDKWSTPGNWEKQKSVINEISKATLPISLSLLGGEPTLHQRYFEFIDILLGTLNEDSELFIVTNGFKSLDFFAKHKRNKKLKFKWALHPEQLDDESFDKIQQNIELMNSLGFESIINVVDDGSELAKHIIRTLNVNVYSDPQINNFNGYSCWHNYFKINLDCEVTDRCFRKFSKIEQNQFKITRIEPKICPHETCSIEELLQIRKEKNERVSNSHMVSRPNQEK